MISLLNIRASSEQPGSALGSKVADVHPDTQGCGEMVLLRCSHLDASSGRCSQCTVPAPWWVGSSGRKAVGVGEPGGRGLRPHGLRGRRGCATVKSSCE